VQEAQEMHELRRRDIRGTTAEKLWSRVRHSRTGCWPWMGQAGDGIGKFHFPPECLAVVRSTTPRRVAFVLGVRDLEPGESVDVTCGNSRCCRPDHLRTRRGPAEKTPGFDAAVRIRIRVMHDRGLGVTAIAQELKMHPGTVSRILRR